MGWARVIVEGHDVTWFRPVKQFAPLDTLHLRLFIYQAVSGARRVLLFAAIISVWAILLIGSTPYDRSRLNKWTMTRKRCTSVGKKLFLAMAS